MLCTCHAALPSHLVVWMDDCGARERVSGVVISSLLFSLMMNAAEMADMFCVCTYLFQKTRA